MRKFLVLGALALVATTSVASAATKVALDGFCNVYSIKNQHGQITAKDSGCSSGFGLGFVAGIHSEGKNAIVGLQDPSSSGYQFVFKFSYPFTEGGTWSLYSTTDGKAFNPVASGNYSLSVPAGRPKTARSVTAR
jgi:hypothetical protein